MFEEKDKPGRSYYGLLIIVAFAVLAGLLFLGYRWVRSTAYDAGAAAAKEAAYNEGYASGFTAGREEAEAETAELASKYENELAAESDRARMAAAREIAALLDDIEPNLTEEYFADCITKLVEYGMKRITIDEVEPYLVTLRDYYFGVEDLAAELRQGNIG